MKVGILGGTGPAGKALGTRLASVAVTVVIGSRSLDRAREACDAIQAKWPERDLPLVPGSNTDAAQADLVIVATPWEAAAATAASVAEDLAGKVVVSMANAIAMVDGELRAVIPPEGSVATAVQQAVPEARVASAFHHVPAHSLADLKRPVTGDILICADHPEAFDATAALATRIPDLRAFHAGSLAMAGPVESFTAVLLCVNRRYKARASIRLSGL